MFNKYVHYFLFIYLYIVNVFSLWLEFFYGRNNNYCNIWNIAKQKEITTKKS